MRPEILIDTEASAGLLSFDGAPVWPVGDAENLEALRAMADVCGLALREVQGRPEPLAPRSDAEVVAVGPFEETGRLYAHLTGRCFRQAQDPDDVVQGDRWPAVVVISQDLLHSDLLSRLYPPPVGEPAPGIVSGRNPAELRRQALCRAAAARPGAPVALRRVDLFPPLSFEILRSADGLLLGGRAAPEQVRAALASGAGLLTLRTHSDGVDAMLGPSLVLCALDRPPEDGNHQRRPRCLITGFCHRRNMGIAEAWQAGLLVAPEALSARVFLWNTCFGLLQEDALVAPEWGHAPRLLANSSIGAVITTWNNSFGSGFETLLLGDALAAGEPIGISLSRYLNLPELRGRALLCLFGDPDMRLPAPPLREESDAGGLPFSLPRRASRETGPSGPCEVLPGDLELMRRAIVRAQGDDLQPELRAAAEAALAAFGHLAAGSAEARTLLEEALLAYLLRRGSDFHTDCSGLAERIEASPGNGTCPYCGRRALCLLVAVPSAGAGERRISSCPRCGRFEDAPQPSNLVLRIDPPRRLAIAGTLPANWRGGVILRSSLPEESSWHLWPGGAEPASVFPLDGELPIGPFQLSVLLLHGDTFTLLSRFTRRIEPVNGSELA